MTGTVRGDIAPIDEIIGVREVGISDHPSSQPTFDQFIRLAWEPHVGGLRSGKAGILHLHFGAHTELVVPSADTEVEHVMARGRRHRFAGTARILGPFEKGTP